MLKQRHRFLFDFQLWNLHNDGLIGFFLLVLSGAKLVKNPLCSVKDHSFKVLAALFLF